MNRKTLMYAITVFALTMLIAIGNGKTVKAGCYSHVATGKYEVTKQPTCGSKGTKVMKCKKCGTVLDTKSIPALGHDWGKGSVKKEATCTAKGTKEFRCNRSNCHATKTESIAAKGHSPSSGYITTKAATCGSKGTKVRKCTRCGGVLETSSIPALGHDWGKGSVTKAATCTAKGTKEYRCNRGNCHATKTESIAAKGHSPSSGYITTKEPTCGSKGTKVRKCTRSGCGKVLETASIPALGHKWNKGEVTKEATCTAKGTKKFRCTRGNCHGEKTEEIAPKGHSASSSYTTTKEPTCGSEGTKVRKCTRCGGAVETAKIPALGHDWDKGTVTKDATCTAKGVKTFRCKRANCHGEKTEAIAAKNHVASSSYITTKEATCVSEGTKVRKCTRSGCGEILETATIPKTGHSMKVVSEKAATCTKDGERVKKCATCDHTERTVLPSGGHKYKTTKYVAPTCVKEGSKTEECTVCSHEKTTKISKIAHDFDYTNPVVTKATTTSTGTKAIFCNMCGGYKVENTPVLRKEGSEETNMVDYSINQMKAYFSAKCGVYSSQFALAHNPKDSKKVQNCKIILEVLNKNTKNGTYVLAPDKISTARFWTGEIWGIAGPELMDLIVPCSGKAYDILDKCCEIMDDTEWYADYTDSTKPMSGSKTNATFASVYDALIDTFVKRKFVGIASSTLCSFVFCDYDFRDCIGDTILYYTIVADKESYEKNSANYTGGAVFAQFCFDSQGYIKRFTIDDSGIVSVTDRQ